MFLHSGSSDSWRLLNDNNAWTQSCPHLERLVDQSLKTACNSIYEKHRTSYSKEKSANNLEISCFKCSDQDCILFPGNIIEHLSQRTEFKIPMLPRKAPESTFEPTGLR